MSQILNLNERKILGIGPYIIHILLKMYNSPVYYIPDNAIKFINSKVNHKFERQIEYIIQHDNFTQGGNDVLVAGFDEGPIPYKIYRMQDGDYLWMRFNYNKELQLAFWISKDWSNWRLIQDNTVNSGISSFAELAYIFSYSVLNKGGIMFHGVVMDWQGNGIIVCAHSGVGKTTHTRMWQENENAKILNGDRALCYLEENKWYSCGSPWNGSSGEYLNSSVKLVAVVVLQQASANKTSLMTPLQGAFELLQLAFAPDWDENLLNCSIAHINDIVRNIPVIKLSCKPDLEAVDVLKKELYQYIDCDYFDRDKDYQIMNDI